MKRDLLNGLARRRIAFRRASFFLPVALIYVLIAVAITSPTYAQSVIRISNDGGGSLSERVSQIKSIRRSGQRVEIRQGYCNSACTLYLGLPTTCVSPNARFGFHGPQIATRGLGMLPAQFEEWSRTMAQHYPAGLRNWFMTSARHSTKLITLRGSQLIQMGVPRCA